MPGGFRQQFAEVEACGGQFGGVETIAAALLVERHACHARPEIAIYQMPDQAQVMHGGGTDCIGVVTGAGTDRGGHLDDLAAQRSEEHTSELQSLMRISYAVFCLKTKKTTFAITQQCIKYIIK